MGETAYVPYEADLNQMVLYEVHGDQLHASPKMAKWRSSESQQAFKVCCTDVLRDFVDARLVHPVVATRWAGTLRKAKTLVMVMCANTAFNPDPDMVSFSCRLSSALRELPEAERRES